MAIENTTQLEGIEPEEAARLFYESRIGEVSSRTRKLDKDRVGAFVEWLQSEGYDDMNDVTARTIHEYKLHTKGDISQNTLAIRLSTIRQFIRFCESIDAVADGVGEKIILPDRSREARTETLAAETAETILAYLHKFDYASRDHAMLSLLWHTGIRSGTLRALDVEDFQPERQRLRIRHRPDTETPLKNGESAERYVALNDDVTAVVADYVRENRTDVEDDHGRRPLFTTRYGRMPVPTIRRNIYAMTRPCQYGEGCPHGRDPEQCDAAATTNDASECPDSVSGHPIRRGSITHFLRRDVPEKVVSDRMNVSQDVLDEHYDRRSDDEKAEQRRQYLDNI